MIGKEWKGQKQDIGIESLAIEDVNGNIGLIDVTESKWINKYWINYPELKKMLQGEGYNAPQYLNQLLKSILMT